MKIYRTEHGPLVQENHQFYQLKDVSWDSLASREDLAEYLRRRIGEGPL